MLPNANGAAVTFMALQAAGRVPAMLNFTSGAHNLVAACEETRIRLVLTSRAFVDKGKLQPEIEAIEAHARIVWLEDMRASTTTMDKLRAALTAGSPLAKRQPDDPAVVLFTSGSEGAPKGVALSHANLLANIAQIGTRFDIRLTDICFNPLPMFHAFGLTGGLLLGLVSSMKVYLYPTPLHYREIPKAIAKAQATFLLGADTFLAHYARNADETAFKSLRYIVAGAEAVKAGDAASLQREVRSRRARRLWRHRGFSGHRRQCARVQQSGNRGQAPAVRRAQPRACPRDRGRRQLLHTGAERHARRSSRRKSGRDRSASGRLVRRGRHPSRSTGKALSPLEGRAKRFAKIAGEGVSLSPVEDFVAGLWPDHVAAAIAAHPIPGAASASFSRPPSRARPRAEVQAWMKTRGASEIMHPSSIVVLDAIPLLGSGKINYVALAKRPLQ